MADNIYYFLEVVTMLLSPIERTVLFFISLSYYNSNSNAIKLFKNNILKPISAETVNLDLLGTQISEILKMDKVISDIIADHGIDKYKAGLNNEDKDLNITQLIQKYSCPPEEHHVRTCDGYILTLIRIPGKGSPVFLMHGLHCSAINWITLGPGALPYLLADLGYDVWLGNSRGSIYSREHERFSPDSKEFWNFSWDEIGLYDLPASIDYVLSVTKQQKLKYVGHSMGNTEFFVMCSELPEYNNKIDLMIAMSPVAWVSHMKSVIRLFLPFRDLLFKFALPTIGKINVLSQDGVAKGLIRLICGTTEFGSFICSNFGFLIFGLGYSQLNITNMPVVFSHFPGEASLNQILHYGQEIESGTFQRFDYGEAKNLAVYGSRKPPKYPVEKITAKVAVIYSLGDWLLDVKDANILVNNLKNVVDCYEVPVKDFCHTDFLWGKDVVKLVYRKVLQLIAKY